MHCSENCNCPVCIALKRLKPKLRYELYYLGEPIKTPLDFFKSEKDEITIFKPSDVGPSEIEYIKPVEVSPLKNIAELLAFQRKPDETICKSMAIPDKYFNKENESEVNDEVNDQRKRNHGNYRKWKNKSRNRRRFKRHRFNYKMSFKKCFY